ncbi:AAA family ATPase [Bacillus sp. Marseille-P3661]|uniref:AAA family ATPase n=1 Tax=Bacillus sp. Marseille-P3661 TaxID=1936234 RepID=UPI0035B55885
MNQPIKLVNDELSKVIIGRSKETKLLFTALIAKGHVLLEDLPGLGKTVMAKAFSRVIDCTFTRIQCTPDLLPSDVIGTTVFHPQKSEFEFKRGPIFNQIVLVDEINRALPRTQSSFLESMEERQISIEGRTLQLQEPFFIIATQNPIEMEGTFPLPEAQLDRFLMNIQFGYLSLEEEVEMIEKVGDALPFEQLEEILSPADIKVLQTESEQVTVRSEIVQYIVALANETRNHSLVSVGVSPRGTKALYKTIKVWALLNGRSYVLPDDVKDLLPYVWGHRLVLKSEVRLTGKTGVDILTEIVNKTEIPKEKVGRYHD